MAGQAAHQRGDYPAAVKHLEEAFKVEPDSTIIQSSLNQAKNSWALHILKDFDEIPTVEATSIYLFKEDTGGWVGF